MARSRNQPRGHLALVVLAILALLAVLAVRVDAAPPPELDDDDADPIGELPAAREPELAPPTTVAAPVFVPAPIAAPPIPVAAVVAAARRAAGVEDAPAASWRRRARLAALVPWLGVRAGRDVSWRDVTDPTLAYVSVFQVSATWHLDRLVFEPNELRIAAIDVSRRRERRRVGEVATRAYYAWLRLRASAGRDARWAGAADEAAAQLDAMTDGWFSEALAKPAELR